MTDVACANTDREIWRETDDPSSSSIHVTDAGTICIIVDGYSITMPIRIWHDFAATMVDATNRHG